MNTELVLVSGARGFIGARLVRALRADGVPVRGLSRAQPEGEGDVQGDLDDAAALAQACRGVGTVFHCAGHAHAFGLRSDADQARHWRVNFEGSLRLAEAAGAAGVRAFVFLSSVKAMGEPGDACVDEDWPVPPAGAYGEAKRAAEDAVLAVGARYGMAVVILRPAMVYGSGGRGNLERMARLVRRGVFPPLPETGNRRSLVHVDDVVAAMRRVAGEPRADRRTYIVAHRRAPSGRELYDALRRASGLPEVAWAMPLAILRFAAGCGDILERISGRRFPLDSQALERLLGSACYAPDRILRELGWQAGVDLDAGLREMLGER